MLSPAKLFRLLSELVFVLLGLLLIRVAVTGRYFFSRRAPMWIGLGVFLILWGLRALWHAGRSASRGEHRVRGGSLVLFGAMMLGIAWLPFSWIAPLLAAAGAVLMVRGMVTAVLLARVP